MQHVRFFLAAVCALFSLSAIGAADVQEKAPKDDPVAKELKRLEGTWNVVKLVYGGKELEKSEDTAVFSGNDLSISSARIRDLKGKKFETERTISLDPTKDPKFMDITNDLKIPTLECIYELTEDSLKIVIQVDSKGKRPTEFKSGAGTKEAFFTFERVKLKK